MAADSFSQSDLRFCARFTGKNYAAWAFQLEMFVKGKGLSGHLDGTDAAPTDKAALVTWQTKDAQIVSWILASIEPHMVNNLRCFSTAKAMWDHLQTIYNQNNTAKRFQLELEIAAGHYVRSRIILWISQSMGRTFCDHAC